MRTEYLVAALLALSPAIAAPSWNTAAPEKALLYRGAPVHPGCLDSMEIKEGDSIDLKACTAAAAKDYKPVSIKNGWFSADGRDDDGIRTGYANYRVLANRGDSFLILTENSGGGSGIFDGLMLFHRNGDTLRLKKFFAGGDRCNGGIAAAAVKNGKLSYSVNLTPYDVAKLTGNTHLEAYQDLSAAAASCVASDDQAVDLESGTSERVSITLTGDGFSPGGPLQDQPGWTENYRYDHCFNAYYNSWFTRGRKILKGAAIEEFGRGFAKACLK